MKYKKLGIVGISILISIFFISGGYGIWQRTLTISGTINILKEETKEEIDEEDTIEEDSEDEQSLEESKLSDDDSSGKESDDVEQAEEDEKDVTGDEIQGSDNITPILEGAQRNNQFIDDGAEEQRNDEVIDSESEEQPNNEDVDDRAEMQRNDDVKNDGIEGQINNGRIAADDQLNKEQLTNDSESDSNHMNLQED